MPAALSSDIRQRVLQKRAEGKTIVKIAEELSLSVSSVNPILKLQKDTGSVEPKPMGGDRRSQKIEVYNKDIIGTLKAKKDATLEEIKRRLARRRGRKARFSTSALLRFFMRHGYTRKKKTGHAAEQSRPGLANERAHFIDKYTESGRVLYINKTGLQPT